MTECRYVRSVSCVHCVTSIASVTPVALRRLRWCAACLGLDGNPALHCNSQSGRL